MNEHKSTHSHETFSAGPVTTATSGPSAAGRSGGGAAPPPAGQAGRSRVWRLLPSRKGGWIAGAALMSAVIGLSACTATSTATSSPATAASPTATAESGAPGSGPAGGPQPAGAGSNARSGPAEGGSIGTVDSVSTPGFTIATSAGQKVTVNETASTTYQKGTTSSSASALTTGEPVLVLGTTSGTTITATQVVVQPAAGEGSATASAADVVPFQRGAPSTPKQLGQVPANYTEGSGTVVDGTAADNATKAALAAYPGGVVDRVVQLSSGEYEVHYIGVNWPHHIFVDQDFHVMGAE